ncbi:MAG: 1-deoxy-D-xylulose-5-phosphate reductoisomerase, partial [Clostridiales bacterium]|nr:1-deoxy-D-xylulose-5-phosphate reductoisomerase [Clostridiales bacterium]
MKTIAILGSTGSIGTQTLDVIRQHRKDFRVSALSAGNNTDLLEKQMREFHPALVSVATEEKARELRVKTADLNIEITYGMEGLLAVAEQAESDILVTAVVGMMGIRPTMAA